jgi:hypothetical protein
VVAVMVALFLFVEQSLDSSDLLAVTCGGDDQTRATPPK